MKILVIQQKMIGDVLVSSILCNNLRIAYPDAQIDYLVYESTIAVLEGNTAISNLILYNKSYRKSRIKILKLGLKIRKEKYDIVIDAYSKLESWIFVFLSGAKKRISYKKPGREFLYTDNVPFANFPETTMGLAIERRLSLLKPLHLDIAIDPYPKLFVSDKEKKETVALFEKHNVQKFVNTRVSEIKDNVIYAVNTKDETNVEIAADTIVNALGSKKNVFDDSKLTVPFTYVGDCSGERTADIASAIRTGYKAANEI